MIQKKITRLNLDDGFPHIRVPHSPTSDKKRIQENERERNTREFWKEPSYDILLAIFC